MKLKFNYIIILAFAAFFSCTKGFEEMNETPDKPSISTLTIPGLFNGISKDITNGNDALNIYLLLDLTNQQAVQNEVTSTAIYNAGLWNSYYPVLFDYKKLQDLINNSPAKAEYSNVKFMADILMASKTLQMLDFYGDIPYTQAGMADNLESRRPAYDKQVDIYKSVLADLKSAAEGIKIGDATQISIGNSDSFLKNDFAAWIRFANALRLRYAVRLYEKEQALANEIITDIIGGNKPLPMNQDLAALEKNNFGFWPSKVTPIATSDRLWNSFAENSISKIRMSSNVWNQMSSNNNTDGSGIFDPRTKVWFMTNNADLWVPQPQNHSLIDGGDPYPGDGARPAIGADADNKFASFNVNLLWNGRQNYPYLIISEADVYFLKAEIYQRGLGVAKDVAAAKTAYEAGIKSSIDFWYAMSWITNLPTKPTPAEITTFLNVPSVAYNGADDADALKKIVTQAWLSAIWNPMEGWALVRRTGLTPKDPTYTPLVKPNKVPYPADEELNNRASWLAALGGTALSLDQQAQIKVYWMP
jgi:hypothetical protein